MANPMSEWTLSTLQVPLGSTSSSVVLIDALTPVLASVQCLPAICCSYGWWLPAQQNLSTVYCAVNSRAINRLRLWGQGWRAGGATRPAPGPEPGPIRLGGREARRVPPPDPSRGPDLSDHGQRALIAQSGQRPLHRRCHQPVALLDIRPPPEPLAQIDRPEHPD